MAPPFVSRGPLTFRSTMRPNTSLPRSLPIVWVRAVAQFGPMLRVRARAGVPPTARVRLDGRERSRFRRRQRRVSRADPPVRSASQTANRPDRQVEPRAELAVEPLDLVSVLVD